MSSATTNSGSRDGNKSRARQKQEIAQLRETVGHLEQQLTRLRRVSPKDSCGSQWRESAERERHQRYAALVENAKLRHKADKQLRLTEKLKKVLYGRHHSEVLTILSDQAIPPMSMLGPSLLDNETVNREMEASLATLPAQCATAFDDAAFQTGTMLVRHIEKRESLETGIHVITAERRVCPFERAALSDAVLRLFGGLGVLRFLASDVSGDLARSDTLLTIEGSRFTGVSRSKILARRHEFDSQTLIVFTGMTDPTHAIKSPCDGLLLQHSGWVRLRSLAGCNGATTYEAFHVATPAAFDVVQDQKRKATLLTNFLQATVGPQLDLGRDRVEDFLLARTSKCRYIATSPQHSTKPEPMKRDFST